MSQDEFISHRARRTFKRAQEALQARNLGEARELAERFVADTPQLEDGWFLLAEIYAELGLNREGLELIDQGLQRWPDKHHFKVQRCKFLAGLGTYKECLALARNSVPKGEIDIWTIEVLAKIFTMLDEVHDALPLYLKACELAPNNPRNWLNLAMTERSCGSIEAARRHLLKAIELQPDFPRAYWVYSSLRKASKADNNIAILEAMSQTGQRSDIHQAYLGYALGKEYEDTEQWQKAFETLCFGAAARGRVKSYRQQDSVNLVESLIHNYNDPEWLQDKVGYSSKEPIFIVGMPRTGTTIVERILGAHSDVYAAGELRQFTLAMGRAFDAGRGPLFDPLQVKQSLSMDFKSLGEDYIASTRIRTGHTRFFTDKLPLNFLYLGLIAKALPKAKIIHLMRNPMDTCWSNFKQMLGDLFIYSYNLSDTAHYYVLYRKLMEHWHQLMPGRILDIEYETLVEDQENQTGRILEYCELPWQQACLDFHQNKDAVTTASSVQVRLPIYRSSLQHWRNFEPYLGEVKTIFDQAGIDY